MVKKFEAVALLGFSVVLIYLMCRFLMRGKDSRWRRSNAEGRPSSRLGLAECAVKRDRMRGVTATVGGSSEHDADL